MTAPRLTRQQRREMLAAYLHSDKSSAVVARRFGVHPSYPRWLAWRDRNQPRKLLRAA